MRGKHFRSVIGVNETFPINSDGFPTTEEITLRTGDCVFEDTSISPNSRNEILIS